MRHIFALVLFTFSIYAQSIKLGFGLGIVFSNNETNTGGIGSILVENDFQNGLVIRTSGSFLLSEFSANNQELKTDQYYFSFMALLEKLYHREENRYYYRTNR